MNPLASGSLASSPSSPMLDVMGAGSLDNKTNAKNIESVGTEFESVFLSMMLKEMRNSLEGGFFGEEGSDTYGGMFDLFIGKELAQSRPLGIADMLLEQYEKLNPSTDTDGSDSKEASPPTSFTA
ncbi:rod-binding protein [Planctomycetes bacterium K23_9]|uniref:Peptidoglycan hydrolase FlgJ n=1 Tax=Stieleria marina TaxID=1930275 RepID=A0A517NSZ6_9BACT|nr:Peptidoglycan hydrolase FlgJ [Planctomycetes bacterium K23_9]